MQNKKAKLVNVSSILSISLNIYVYEYVSKNGDLHDSIAEAETFFISFFLQLIQRRALPLAQTPPPPPNHSQTTTPTKAKNTEINFFVCENQSFFRFCVCVCVYVSV